MIFFFFVGDELYSPAVGNVPFIPQETRVTCQQEDADSDVIIDLSTSKSLPQGH